MAFVDDNEQDLGAEIRDPAFLAYLTENFSVDPPPEEIYPGDRAYLTSMGYNPNNISPDLDYKQRQEFSDQLRKAWFSRTKEGLETEPQYQFQTPMSRIMTASEQGRANPAETGVFFDESKYMGDADKLARESGMRTVPVEDYSFARDTVSDLPSFFGKDPEGAQPQTKFASAPEEVQKLMYHVPQSSDYGRALTLALEDSEAFKDAPPNYDWGVSIEPHKEKVMYRDPNHGGQYTYLFQPGLDAFDVKQEGPKLGTMGVVGVASAVFSGHPVAGPALTDTMLWMGFRTKELRDARKNNLLKKTIVDPETGEEITEDWSDREINIQGLKEAGFIFGASMLTPILISGLARAGRKIDPGNPAFETVYGLGLDKEALVAGTEILEVVFKEMSEKEGGEAAGKILQTLSAPEIIAYARNLQQTGKLTTLRDLPKDKLNTLIDRLYGSGAESIEGGALQLQMVKYAETQSGPTAELIKTMLRRKRELIDELRTGQLSEAGYKDLAEITELTNPEVASEGGLAIIGGVEAAKRGEIIEAEKALTKIETNALNLGKEASEGGVPGSILATELRGGIQKLQDKAFAATSKRYDDVYAKIRAESVADDLRPFDVDIAPLMNYAGNRLKEMKQSLLSDLQLKEGGGNILEQFGRRQTYKVAKQTPTGTVWVDAYKRSPFEQFQDDIVTLRRFKREAANQGKYQLEWELRGLEQEMVALRRDTLISAARNMTNKNEGQALLKEITDLEKTYAQNIGLWRKGFVGDLMERTKSSTKGVFGEYKMSDIAFLNTVLSNSFTKKEIEPLLNLVNQRADIRLMFVNAIRGRYKHELDLNQGKPLTPGQHRSFMNKNDEALNNFLTKDEMAMFTNAQEASIGIKTQQRQQQLILDRINKTPWGVKLTDEDIAAEPQTIFNKMWKSGGTSDKFNANKELFEILDSPAAGKQGKEAIKSFKGRILRDMDEKANIFGTQGDGTVSTEGLNTYLKKHGNLLEVWYGKKFVQSMDTLQTMSRFIDDLPVKGARAGERGFYQMVLSNLIRMIVGIFTREGRALTAIQVVGGKFGLNRIMGDLAEGEKLATRVKATKWMRDPKLLETIRRGLVLGELYTGQPNIIGEAVPKANLPAGELDIETAPVIPPVLRGLTTYDKYESYNIGGRVKRSKLMPLRYDI